MQKCKNKSSLLSNENFSVFFAADSWPQMFDDTNARNDWGWKHEYGFDELVDSMIKILKPKYT